MNLWERAEAVTPGGVHTSLRRLDFPLTVARAEGGYFEDGAGKRYLDFHGAFGPILLGHRDPRVEGAVRKAMDRVDLVGTGITDYEVVAAELICRHVPSVEKVLFTNSGSEATAAAIRLARAVTGRPGLIKFQGCYHGHHDCVAMNVITPREKLGSRDLLSAGMLPGSVAATHVAKFNDPESVERIVKANAGQVAGIILELIPHNIGCVMPDLGFLEGLRALCDREGIVLIFDEVITGFRHHIGGYQAVCGVMPDLTALGKAMANGWPCAAVGGKAKLMDRFNTRPGGDTFFAGTFNAHPYSMAACAATIAAMEDGGLHRKLFAMGDRMRTGLKAALDAAGVPSFVAGFGSVFVPYFMKGEPRCYEDLLANDAALFVRFRRLLMDEGVFMLPMNLKRSALMAAHGEAEVDRVIEAAKRALGRL